LVPRRRRQFPRRVHHDQTPPSLAAQSPPAGGDGIGDQISVQIDPGLPTTQPQLSDCVRGRHWRCDRDSAGGLPVQRDGLLGSLRGCSGDGRTCGKTGSRHCAHRTQRPIAPRSRLMRVAIPPDGANRQRQDPEI
jgi:hypothetical protein